MFNKKKRRKKHKKCKIYEKSPFLPSGLPSGLPRPCGLAFIFKEDNGFYLRFGDADNIMEEYAESIEDFNNIKEPLPVPVEYRNFILGRSIEINLGGWEKFSLTENEGIPLILDDGITLDDLKDIEISGINVVDQNNNEIFSIDCKEDPIKLIDNNDN